MSEAPSREAVLPEGEVLVDDAGQVEAALHYLEVMGDGAELVRRMVLTAQSELAGLRSDAVSAVRGTLDDRLLPGALALVESVDGARNGFLRYAAGVRDLDDRALRLLSEAEGYLDEIRTRMAEIRGILEDRAAPVGLHWRSPVHGDPPAAGSSPYGLGAAEGYAEDPLASRWRAAAERWSSALDDLRLLEIRWSELAEDRRRAERDLLASLADTELGRLVELSGPGDTALRRVIALGISGGLRNSEAPATVLSVDHPLLVGLLGGGGREIWESPPDPRVVAANWTGLDEDERQTLISESPWAIGNLPGLPFATRDEANRRLLEFYDFNRLRLGEEGLIVLDELRRIVSAFEGPPAVSIVSLDLEGDTPMVVLGYGELDGADCLTWQVPGMGSDAHQALPTWDEASRNLYAEQSELADLAGLGRVGTLVFLAYDTPDMGRTLDVTGRGVVLGTDGVLSAGSARQGAVRLAAELDGVSAATARRSEAEPGPGASGSPRIAVIGHSYGTTTAANALTLVRRPVDAFVMMGSAGIDTGAVASLHELRVAASTHGRPAVYASTAPGDTLAPVGILLSGRANPNPDFAVGSAPNYGGAVHFPSEGFLSADGKQYEGTDGHSAVGAHGTAWYRLDRWAGQALGFEASGSRGYWDAGTQSLWNMAAVSLGQDRQVVGGLHVSEE